MKFLLLHDDDVQYYDPSAVLNTPKWHQSTNDVPGPQPSERHSEVPQDDILSLAKYFSKFSVKPLEFWEECGWFDQSDSIKRCNAYERVKWLMAWFELTPIIKFV